MSIESYIITFQKVLIQLTSWKWAKWVILEFQISPKICIKSSILLINELLCTNFCVFKHFELFNIYLKHVNMGFIHYYQLKLANCYPLPLEKWTKIAKNSRYFRLMAVKITSTIKNLKYIVAYDPRCVVNVI